MSSTSTKTDNNLSQAMIRRRIICLFAIVCLGFSGIVVKLSWVQVIKNSFYKQKAIDQRMRAVAVDAKRGSILDRQGRELAVSVSADSIYAVPVEVTDKEGTAKKLAEILDMDEEQLLKKLKTNQQTVWIKRKVTGEASNEIRKLALPGIAITESSERFYPKGTLAAHVLGFAGVDNQGLEGLEMHYDSTLKGTNGQIVAERDATGKEIPEGKHSYVSPVDGNTVVLTIDEVIQYICEREITKAVEETGSSRGLALAMEPETGEILAVAISPAFDPNSFGDYTAQERRNFAFTDTYEPGSTFKVITSAAALEEGIVNANTGFYDPGYVKVKDSVLKCWKLGGHGQQTFEEALGNSCNPVFVNLALNLGAEKFTSYIKAFGFGSKTGVDFPGEAVGSIQDLSKKGPVELATTGFGQGISVTPIQLLNAVCAVANGGTLMKPVLVKEVIDAEGNTVSKTEPTKIRQVISEKTATELTRMMVSVVSESGGNKAAVEGFAVAGKTGTAQKPTNGRYGDGRIASFVGFMPAEDPQIAMLIVLDEPQCQIKYGGTIAAPVFSSIMTECSKYMELIPSYPSEYNSSSQKQDMVKVPNVVGKSQEDANKALKDKGFAVRYEGFGDAVTEQVPKAGASVPKGTSVVVYFENQDILLEDEDYVVVPNVIGKTLKEAAMVLGAKGLAVIPGGSGTVSAQTPVAGTVVKRGAAVELYLE